MLSARLGFGLAWSTVGAFDPAGDLTALVFGLLLQIGGHALRDAEAALYGVVSGALTEVVGNLLEVDLKSMSALTLGG